MIFDTNNTKGKKVKVVNDDGTIIPAVFKYNTRTREAHMYLLGNSHGRLKTITTSLKKGKVFPRKVVKIKAKILGSYILVDGKRY